MIQFHGYFRSSAAYRCRIAFNLKGLAYDFASVHLRRNGGEQKSAGYRALNPQALVPTIKAGELILGQSLAIIEWLDETHPEPALLPSDKNLRAEVRAFAQVIACDIHPLQNLRVLEYLKSELGQDQAAADSWCRQWIGDGLRACEEILARAGTSTRFCFGETPSVADICLIPQIFSAERFSVDLSELPRIREINAACQALAAFADAHPTRQPDAEA